MAEQLSNELLNMDINVKNRLMRLEKELARVEHEKSTEIKELQCPQPEIGGILWKIQNVTPKHCESQVYAEKQFIYSELFYSSRYGHLMRARLALNGFGAFYGRSLGIEYRLMKGGEYDDILAFPFRGRITVCLINQRNPGKKDIKLTLDCGTVHMFEKEKNPSWYGHCNLAKISKVLDTREGFIVRDNLYFKISVDMP